MTDEIEVWYFMIPIAMIFVGIAIVVFFWSVKNDQFEDLDRHGSNILFDDDKAAHQEAQQPTSTTNKDTATPSDTATSREKHDHSA